MKPENAFRIIRNFLSFAVLLVAFQSALSAYAWQWASKGKELPFTVEVPPDWVAEHASRSNGVIAVFSQRFARIEVRSFTLDEMPSLTELINMKAARLSSVYQGIRQVYEKKSDLRKGLYLTAWELRRGGTDYYEETAFYVYDNGVITVSCLAPRSMFRKFRVVFDNAIFSIRPDADAPVSEEQKPAAMGKGLKSLLTLFPYAMPNAEKQLVMKWKSAPVEKPVEEVKPVVVKEPAKTDPPKKEPAKTTEKAENILEDVFLPPIE